MCSDEAGVVFIDGAHHFYSPGHYRGKRVLDFMFEEIERQRGRVVIILAGQEEGMRKVLGHGGDPRGHFPNVINFKDFEDEGVRSILYEGLKKKFGREIEKGKMAIEGGKDGLYMRIAARMLARGRKIGPGSSQFSNARAVENLCKIIWERQARSARRERRSKRREKPRKRRKMKRLHGRKSNSWTQTKLKRAKRS